MFISFSLLHIQAFLQLFIGYLQISCRDQHFDRLAYHLQSPKCPREIEIIFMAQCCISQNNSSCMAHFGSIQMGILITPCSLHTDLPICSSWQISCSCFKSSDLFFWLNPWAFLLFSSAFNSFIVIFEDFRIIRACGFWKSSFTWLPIRVTCMPFLSALLSLMFSSH